MKATADDENPCPGYLFQEIGSILYPASVMIYVTAATSGGCVYICICVRVKVAGFFFCLLPFSCFSYLALLQLHIKLFLHYSLITLYYFI